MVLSAVRTHRSGTGRAVAVGVQASTGQSPGRLAEKAAFGKRPRDREGGRRQRREAVDRSENRRAAHGSQPQVPGTLELEEHRGVEHRGVEPPSSLRALLPLQTEPGGPGSMGKQLSVTIYVEHSH